MTMGKKVFMTVVIAAFAITLAASRPQAAGKPQKDGRMKVTHFSKDKLVEIAFSSIKPDKLNQFNNLYIPQIVPIITENGGGFVLRLHKDRVLKGNIDSFTIALLQWPSVESFIKTGKDPRVPDLLKMRNQTLAYINEANFFALDEDASFHPNPAAVYELVAARAAVSLEPLVKKSQGVIRLRLKLDHQSFGPFKPREVYLIEWRDKAGQTRFDQCVKEHGTNDVISHRITAKYVDI